MSDEQPKKRGRKSTFNALIRDTILRLIEEGKTEQEIADIIGISKTTLTNWKGKHPEFLYAVREARQVADGLVEAALFSRAIGYSHPEQKAFQYEGVILTHDMQKHYPPDTTAAMFWLRNRQPKRWKEKTEGDVNVNNNVNTGQVTDEQLENRLQELLQKRGLAPKDPA